MTSAPPRRIGSLKVSIHVPQTLTPENRQKLERAAHTCPVHKSLHPDIHIPIEFTWGADGVSQHTHTELAAR